MVGIAPDMDGAAAETVGSASGAGTQRAAQRTLRNRLLLLSPTLVIIGRAAAGPLLIVAIYSVLEKGSYAGVIWQLSGEAWFNVFLEQDIFDDTIGFADAHLSIFLRSLKLAVMATFMLTSSPPGRRARATSGSSW